MKRKTFETIRKFIKSGGKVIADTLLPLEFLEAPRTNAREEVKLLFGIDPYSLLESFLHQKKVDIHQQKNHAKVFVIQGMGLHRFKKKEVLKKLLNLCITPDITIDQRMFFAFIVRKTDMTFISW